MSVKTKPYVIVKYLERGENGLSFSATLRGHEKPFVTALLDASEHYLWAWEVVASKVPVNEVVRLESPGLPPKIYRRVKNEVHRSFFERINEGECGD